MSQSSTGLMTTGPIWKRMIAFAIPITVQFIPQIEVVYWAYPFTWTLSSLCFVIYLWKADWLHAYDRIEEGK